MSEKLPLELLKEKYLPLPIIVEKYQVSEEEIMSLISQRKLKYAEFRVPGETRRSIHINPEDLVKVLISKERGN